MSYQKFDGSWRGTAPYRTPQCRTVPRNHPFKTKLEYLNRKNHTMGQNHNFCRQFDLILTFQIMWILWKMRFWNCEFWEKWGFEITIVKNEILKLRFLRKMSFCNVIFVKIAILKIRFQWKMSFCNVIFVKNCDFENTIFMKSGPLKYDFYKKIGFWNVIFVKNVILKMWFKKCEFC